MQRTCIANQSTVVCEGIEYLHQDPTVPFDACQLQLYSLSRWPSVCWRRCSETSHTPSSPWTQSTAYWTSRESKNARTLGTSKDPRNSTARLGFLPCQAGEGPRGLRRHRRSHQVQEDGGQAAKKFRVALASWIAQLWLKEA